MKHTEHNQANGDIGQEGELWDVAAPPPPGQNIPQHVPPVAPVDPPIAPAPPPDFMGGDPVVNVGQEGELWDVAAPPPPQGFANRVRGKRDNPGKGGSRTT